VYLTDAPVSIADGLALTLAGYSSNLSRYNVTAGEWVVAPPVHLTGDGIVEGRVVSYPGGGGVAGATVAVCPKAQSNCPDQVTTNASGYFAMVAHPGVDSVTVTAAGFVTNTPDFVSVVSDTWLWAGVVTVYKYAHVTGTVLGLPDGLPLAGANASLCGLPSPGENAGPCFATVLTGPDGSFLVQVPAGVYILDVNTTFYNDSYLEVSLLPGETFSVGTVFVQEYGSATGSVDSSLTDAPIVSATVTACENWGSATCGRPTSSGADGRFAVSGPPGPYTLEVSAAGYQASFGSVHLASAATSTVPTFLLIPIGPDNSYVVSGTVSSAGASPGVLGGAVVTASGGISTDANSVGAFSLVLPWGTYVLTAALPGYLDSSRTVVVHGPTPGVGFSLSEMTYAVTGIVTDGLSGQPLANVQITQGGSPVGAATSVTGAFELLLSNGTHFLVAGPPGGSAAYAPVPFSVSVNGAVVVHNIAVFPPAVSVDGFVASALSGMPIAGATVTLSGMTAENLPWTTSATTGPDGRFIAVAYPGTYEVRASESGFHSGSVSLQVNDTASVPVSLDLAPVSSSGPAPSGAPLLWAVAGIGGAAALAVGLVLWVRRPPARPANAPAIESPRYRGE
jgi:hypothetical protein